MTPAPVTMVEGKAIPLQGHDIDTDRIIPARFLKSISFTGLGNHVFADDRAAAGGCHPFDRPEHQGARILVVNRNFGCGSSREHAPQALRRWGIAAVIGESFAEIFASNCLALGMPCLRGETGVVEDIQQLVQEQPGVHFCLTLAAPRLRGPDRHWPLMIESGPQTMLLNGGWDGTGLLLSHGDELQRTALRLPYLNDFVLSS
ncbi:MAG: 3-isopropylmalate dehydratase small subunit [Synechococcus sp. SB0662_bin_45]|uniref:3-isopropylmalate dehydratase small subunit n=1 Tax=Synechococcus sp. SB0676_bin_10 TaxID=2604869 RepID=A0A6B1F6T3_9SYNE|nr:3-isopropylmalate dehydratase small subunit [Cyanobacteria bacterium MAG IRC3_bin_20]MXW11466.1 3-isopropylmalate dehydratase small subunit [Synechococcus sp. SB0668_bin_13]MXX08111.1 3-isopropylmalate dehydratase small subunit [Synechococcus sp. SB0667_bin_8]MXY18630.1 3-isopropylmalate dehydratase small subunit [Synechococcus sp. SB0664_bin_36]MYE21289.1 3-isopropylmalate dehydratase small subunit [Synechococcus sp. SB0662_bin_45]MYG39070.1 3-isopropylmalate dehydratase small subunit [Syn